MKKIVLSIMIYAGLTYCMEEPTTKSVPLGLKLFAKNTYTIEQNETAFSISSNKAHYPLFIKKDELTTIRQQAEKSLTTINLFTPMSYRMRKLKQSIAPVVLTTIGCFNLYQACKRGGHSGIDLLTINFAVVGIAGSTIGLCGLVSYADDMVRANTIVKQYKKNAQNNVKLLNSYTNNSTAAQ